MSKASERVDAYPAVTFGEKHAYLNGYRQAEKDCALTPEDVGVIYNLVRNLQYQYDDMNECYYEALRLYDEAKNEAEIKRGIASAGLEG